MKHIPLALLLLAGSAVGCLYGWTHLRSILPREERGLFIIEGPPKHLVTPEMATASRAMVARPAPRFAKPGTDGRTHELDEMLRNGPIVLTFIKHGCPCSEAAQSFFNALHAAYPGASMRGVIDVGDADAKVWAESFGVDYPLLIDPGGELVRLYAVENSAYVVLIGKDGEIAKHWPGYSESMLRELSAIMADMTHSSVRMLDLSDAPIELYTGCPYEL